MSRPAKGCHLSQFCYFTFANFTFVTHHELRLYAQINKFGSLLYVLPDNVKSGPFKTTDLPLPETHLCEESSQIFKLLGAFLIKVLYSAHMVLYQYIFLSL